MLDESSLRVWSPAPSVSHAFRVAWPRAWLSASPEGRRSARASLERVGVRPEVLDARGQRATDREASHS
eukprot:13698738-Alexandrium_andersonii.AAC.1